MIDRRFLFLLYTSPLFCSLHFIKNLIHFNPIKINSYRLNTTMEISFFFFVYTYQYNNNGLPNSGVVTQGLPGHPTTSSNLNFSY